MSTTRSPSPKEPATDRPVVSPVLRDVGLLLLAHGSTRASSAQRVPHVRRLTDTALFDEVGAAFLKGSPSLDEALAVIRSLTICAVPLLMSDGVIAQRLRHALSGVAAGRHVIFTRPIGLCAKLSAIIARQVTATCQSHGLTPAATNILLVAHGAKADPASREAAHDHAARLSQGRHFAAIATSFLEEPASVADALAALPGDVVVVGLFAGGGAHAERDLPAQVAAARSDHPGTLIYAGAIGDDPGIADLIIGEANRAIAAEAG